MRFEVVSVGTGKGFWLPLPVRDPKEKPKLHILKEIILTEDEIEVEKGGRVKDRLGIPVY